MKSITVKDLTLKNNDCVIITLPSGLTFESVITIGKQLNNTNKVVEGFFFKYKNSQHFIEALKKYNKSFKISLKTKRK